MIVDLVFGDSFWTSGENLVMAGAGEDRLREWLVESEAFEGGVYFRTSGSTGDGKWVVLSKEALLWSARAVNRHLEVREGGVWFLALPEFHVGGFGVIARAFACGGRVEVFEGKWDVVRFVRELEGCSGEYVSLVPAQVVDLVRAGLEAPDCVRRVIVGGGRLDDDTFLRAQGLGWPVYRTYGMTEAGSQIATGDVGDGWLRVIEGWELEVRDGGRLAWRGVGGFSGYLVELDGGFVFEDGLDEDGWFLTSDVVERGSGVLRFLRRDGRMVKILGELVDLDAVEVGLGVECVVVPVPDERRGFRLVAVVEGDVEDLAVGGGLHAISEVIRLERFPRSGLGKIRRGLVEEMVLGGDFSGELG